MPRKARLYEPGMLRHLVVRGIERWKIFRDDSDREDFPKKLEGIQHESVPNHADGPSHKTDEH